MPCRSCIRDVPTVFEDGKTSPRLSHFRDVNTKCQCAAEVFALFSNYSGTRWLTKSCLDDSGYYLEKDHTFP